MNTHVTTADVSGSFPYDPYKDPHSVEFGFRSRRFEAVQRLMEAVLAERGSCHILDLGGTETYWFVADRFIREHKGKLKITLVNTEEQTIHRTDLFDFVLGSATEAALMAGRRFDLVFSNSVIEHVGSHRDMERFALNVRRLADRYYVQTPNFWFPYEPHFRFPGFQYLPAAVRAQLIMTAPLGFFPRIGDRAEAREIIRTHRLISTRHMRALFPDADISFEKLWKLNKSIVAIRDRAPPSR
jgi:hypothetical protein